MIEERLKKLEEAVFGKTNTLKKGDYVEISGISFRCYNEKERLCTTIEELSEEVIQNSAKGKVNMKCVKGNKVMFNSNVIDGEYGTSIIRKVLQGFENKYLDTTKLNKVFGKDYVRLLNKEEIEELGEELNESINNWYWTMSYRFSDSDNWALVFFVYGSSNPGHLNGTTVNTSYVVRPVVSLKSDVLLTGEGSKENPYKLN